MRGLSNCKKVLCDALPMLAIPTRYKSVVIKSPLLLVLGVAVASCGGGGAGQQQFATICDFQSAEPVLSIQSVTDSVNGGKLASVQLSKIKLNDLPVSAAEFLGGSSNVAVSGDLLICTAPCAFSSSVGKYSFSVAASGYRQQDVSVQASYANRSSSCPVILSGGTKIDLTMIPN